jgi:hypothetical protein
VPSESIDFVWSHAVLEHVRRAALVDVIRELRRVVRDDGVQSHQVDLRDHLGGSLNNLRFPTRVWEHDLFAESGFYTNRLRLSQFEAFFVQAGFRVELCHVDRWATPPLERQRLAPEFRRLGDDDLCTRAFSVLLRPAVEDTDGRAPLHSEPRRERAIW